MLVHLPFKHAKQLVKFDLFTARPHLLQLRVQIDASLIIGVLQPVRLDILPHGAHNASPGFLLHAENLGQLLGQDEAFG